MFSYFVFAPPMPMPMPMPMMQFHQPYGFGFNAYGPGPRTSSMTWARNESPWTPLRPTTCDVGLQSGLGPGSRSGTNPDESTAGRFPFEQWLEKSTLMVGKLDQLLAKLTATTCPGKTDANGAVLPSLKVVEGPEMFAKSGPTTGPDAGSGTGSGSGSGSGLTAALAYCQLPQNLDNWQCTGVGPVV